MADVWRPDLAKRFYGYVAAGGSAGAILGPHLVSGLVHETGPAPLIVMACAFIMASALFASFARRSLRRAPDGARVPDAAIPVGGRAVDDLRRLVSTPYLLGIAGIIVAGQIIGGFMYNEQGKLVAENYHSLADRAALFARMEFYVNVLSLVFQAVVVTWLTRRGSVASQPLGDARGDRRQFRGDGAVSVGNDVPRHPGVAARGRLRARQAAARNAVHGASTRRASSRARASSTRCCTEARTRSRNGSIC